MKLEDKALERIGEDIAETFGDGATDECMDRQREILLSLTDLDTRVDERRRLIPMAIAASLLIAACGVAALYLLNSDSLEHSNDRTGPVLTTGAWFESEAARPLALYLDDGSSLYLEAKSALRVNEKNTRNVDLDLSHGSLHVHVQKGGDAKWVFRAGPYAVNVLGTAFDVSWSPQDANVRVEVTRGTVLVTGPNIENDGIKLSKGQVLSGNNASVSVTRAGDGVVYASTALEEPTPTEAQGELKEAVSNSTAAGSKSMKPGSDVKWIAFYKEEKYREALKEARSVGIDVLLKSASSRDLWWLGETARNSGEADLSKTILIRYRQRFGKNTKARIAAFLLGRLNVDQLNDPVAAVRWFKIYLDEAPSGSLSEEALGRLIIAYKKAGNADQSRRVATDYLSTYPDGAFAELAQSVLPE